MESVITDSVEDPPPYSALKKNLDLYFGSQRDFLRVKEGNSSAFLPSSLLSCVPSRNYSGKGPLENKAFPEAEDTLFSTLKRFVSSPPPPPGQATEPILRSIGDARIDAKLGCFFVFPKIFAPDPVWSKCF